MDGLSRSVQPSYGHRIILKRQPNGVALPGFTWQVLTAGESALQAKSEGFKAGIHTAQDLLDAQRDWFRARRDYTQARHAYVVNRLRLKQAAGTLSENDVMQINSWLQSP